MEDIIINDGIDAMDFEKVAEMLSNLTGYQGLKLRK